MSTDSMNMDEIDEARRQSIAESVHPVSVEELKALGEGLFPYLDHPWREKFFNFIAENQNSTFVHAITHDRVHIVYCETQDKGMWFIPGSGSGPLQAKGRAVLKELVKGK